MQSGENSTSAKTLLEQGRFDEVVALVEPRVAEGRLDLDSAIALARAYIRLQRPKEAVALYDAVCKAVPQSAETHVEAGAVAHMLGHRLQAEAWLKHAAALAPQMPEAHYHLGLTQAALGDPRHHEAAFEAFGRAANLRPDWVEAWYARAQLGYNNAHIAEALQASEQCISLNPDYADAWYLRYMCLADSGQTDGALSSLRRFVELRPDHAAATRELRRLDSMLGEKRRPVARFPKHVAMFQQPTRLFEDHILPELDGIEPFLTPSSVVLTTGSCFARNITLSLEKLGVAARHIEQLEDISNTYANRYFFEWLAGQRTEYAELFEQAFPSQAASELRDLLRVADVLVFSLGVAPCFFDRTSGRFILTLGVNHSIALQSETVDFRTTTVEENVENLRRIDEIVFRINPQARFILTLSPVPLKATFGRGSAIVADCLSKSTLRVAGEAFLASTKLRSFYWPSFEMVRWFGGYASYSVFGKEDGNPRHVNADLVDDILGCFIERFATPALRQRLHPTDTSGAAVSNVE